jgi:hypothetical protein
MTQSQQLFRQYLLLLPKATREHFQWNVFVYPPPKVIPPMGIAIDRGIDENTGNDITECGVGRYMGDFTDWLPGSGGDPKPDRVYHGPDYRFGDHPDLSVPDYLSDVEPRVIPFERERFRMFRANAERKIT